MSSDTATPWLFVFGAIQAVGTLVCAYFAYQSRPTHRPHGVTVNHSAEPGWFIAAAILGSGALYCLEYYLYVVFRSTHPYVLLASSAVVCAAIIAIWVLLFQSKPWVSPSKLVIQSANYAAAEGGGKPYDVAECMRQMIAGDSLVLDIENHNFVVGKKNFVPHDPKTDSVKRLQVTYSYDGEPTLTIDRPEHGRIVLPEDFKTKQLSDEVERVKQEAADQIARLNKQHEADEYRSHQIRDDALSEVKRAESKVRQLEAELNEIRFSLESRTFALCKEIRKFIQDVGPAPHIEQGSSNASEHAVALREHLAKQQQWKNKFESAYRLRLEQPLRQIRNELLGRGQKDSEIDHFIFGEVMANAEMLEAVAKDLAVMAGNLYERT